VDVVAASIPLFFALIGVELVGVFGLVSLAWYVGVVSREP